MRKAVRLARERGSKFALLLSLVVSVGLISCAGGFPESGSQAQDSGQPIALLTATLTPQPTPTLTAAPSATPMPLELLILHTNDNWGETEPCG